MIHPALVFLGIWAFWAGSWLLASLWSAPTVRRPDAQAARVVYLGALVAGGILLWHRTSELLGVPKLWHVGYEGAYALAGVVAIGCAFAWWARIYLGRLWSGAVALKEGHRVVDTGPYRIVRHPIYTGFAAGVLASAGAVATWPAIAGALIIVIAFTIKARIEEQFLTAELGDTYAQYRHRAPMLVPFWPVR